MKIVSSALDELIEQITSQDVSYENEEGCVRNSKSLINPSRNKLNELKAQGPTV